MNRFGHMFNQGESLGKCPCCQKGQLVKWSDRWMCDYFQFGEEPCSFTVYRTYKGYEMTDEDVLELMSNGKTGPREFLTHEGVPFTACLQLERKHIKVARLQDAPQLICPHCGGKVKITKKGYICERYSTAEPASCRFYLPAVIFGRAITREIFDEISSRGRTEVLDGFYYQGKQYSSCLTVMTDGTVKVDGRICRCPKCGGIVYAGTKCYHCENYRNPSRTCNFVIWRIIGKAPIMVDDVRQLCCQGRTRIIRFQTMEGVFYDKALVLDGDYKVRMSD